MTDAREGMPACVIYDVPELRPVPLPDMICVSPTGLTDLYRAAPSELDRASSGPSPASRQSSIGSSLSVYPQRNRAKPTYLRQPAVRCPRARK